MKRLLLIASLLALPAVSPAVAAPVAVSETQSLAVELKKAETSVSALEARLAAASAETDKMAVQIDTLKRAPQSARRDRELQDLLAASQAKTDGELARVQAELRWRRPALAVLRRRFVRTIDAALLASASELPDSSRQALVQQRAATLALLATTESPAVAQQPATVSADPLDGPRELRHKADLLRDSGDKLRKEANRIMTRLDGAERRRHLRERAGSLDDDMFGEATSNRRVTRTSAALGTSAQNKGAEATGATSNSDSAHAPNDPAPAAPATPSQGGFNGTPTGTTGPGNNGGNGSTPVVSPPTARTSESTVLRNLIDPSTLEELNRADAGDDVDRQTRALRRAQSELESRAKDLDKRAKLLEQRAVELQNKK